MRSKMSWLKARYESLAVFALNTVVVFGVVNLFMGAAYVGYRAAFAPTARADEVSRGGGYFHEDGSPVDNGRRSAGQLRMFDYRACSELDPSYVSDVLDDFHEFLQTGMIYQPWVQFAEAPFEGKRVSIKLDELGVPYRGTVDSSDSQSANIVRIYALGGSTTFGYHVSDEHTWPSHLSRILNARARQQGLNLRVEVTNYGRGYYYPTQEVALMTDLLRSGHRPSLIIYLDGLNVGFFQDVPHFSSRVEQAFYRMQHAESDWSLVKSLRLNWFPLWRLAKWIRSRAAAPEGSEATMLAPEEVDHMAALLARRFEEDRRIAERVAALYGVETLFVVQPNALVNYSRDLYRFELDETFERAGRLSGALYRRLRHQEGTVYLGDLFEQWGSSRKALVDRVHYSPAFHEFLASRIGSHIDLTRLKVSTSPSAVDDSKATGVRREGESTRRSPLL